MDWKEAEKKLVEEYMTEDYKTIGFFVVPI